MSPYSINEPAAISFSGGRTSAYMLYKILEAHDGVLPDDVKVVFANTGKEMPQTLDFVRDCGEQWEVDITWVELGEYKLINDGSDGKRRKFEKPTVIVNYETASRKGEPFARLIDKRSYLPNPVTRFCTQELKINRIREFMKTQFDEFSKIIGIRADEPRRAHKLMGKNEPILLPLYWDGVTKEEVGDFWNAQNFDLQLPNNNGVTDWGNCDLCFLKGYGKKQAIIRERPDLADWWIKQEDNVLGKATTAAFFRADQPNYADMKMISTDQGQLFDFGDDESISCFCGD